MHMVRTKWQTYCSALVDNYNRKYVCSRILVAFASQIFFDDDE